MEASDVLVDTAGFLALWDSADQHHTRAVQLQNDLRQRNRGFLTTDYILDETVTILLMRHSHAAAADFIRTATTSEVLRLEWVDSDRFRAATSFFVRHDDKEWSFTDCVSFVLMQELELEDCFTTDHHFSQAGFNPLLKP